MSICIIGAGATGLLLLLLLQEAAADLSKITIIDPYFDGGDLARKWTGVISNTPWSKTVDSLNTACPSLNLPAAHDSTTPLIEIANLLRSLATPLLKKTRQIQGYVTQTNYNSEKKKWMTTIDRGDTVITDRLILAQGSEPKSMDLPIPSIPLEIALDQSRLKYYVKPGEKVIMFGTMHSGALIMNNLVALGTQVTAYYNSQKPFYWARDGAYDGIKADAADIADKVMRGEIPVTLVATKDTAKVIRTSHDAQWLVYAIGFAPRNMPILIDGVPCSAKEYDGASGRLTNAPAWGFGIAYPNRAPDGIHWDVGVASFLEHMKRQISDILA